MHLTEADRSITYQQKLTVVLPGDKFPRGPSMGNTNSESVYILQQHRAYVSML